MFRDTDFSSGARVRSTSPNAAAAARVCGGARVRPSAPDNAAVPPVARFRRDPLGALGEKRGNLEMRRERRTPQPPGTPVTPQDEAMPAEWRAFASEPLLAAIEDELRSKIESAGDQMPFPPNWNASLALARMSW